MEMCLCRTRDFINKIPGYTNKNVIIFIKNAKNEEYLEFLQLYLRLKCRLTVLLSYKHYPNVDLFDEVWNMGYKQDGTIINVEIFPNAESAFEKLYYTGIKPSLIITDGDSIPVFISKRCSCYIVYNLTTLSTQENMTNLLGLSLAPLDFINIRDIFLHTSPENMNRFRQKLTVQNIIHDIPFCHILFTALGQFQKHYNYQFIITGFLDFLHNARQIYGHKILLVLQGDSDKIDEIVFTELETIVNTTIYRSNFILIKRNLNFAEKKALLRMSYAMIYLNTSSEPTPNLRTSLMVGTPVIALRKGYAKNVLVHEYTGYIIPTMDIPSFVTYLYKLTNPVTYKSFSEQSRQHYLREHTLLKYAFKEFDREDNLDLYNQFERNLLNETLPEPEEPEKFRLYGSTPSLICGVYKERFNSTYSRKQNLRENKLHYDSKRISSRRLIQHYCDESSKIYWAGQSSKISTYLQSSGERRRRSQLHRAALKDSSSDINISSISSQFNHKLKIKEESDTDYKFRYPTSVFSISPVRNRKLKSTFSETSIRTLIPTAEINTPTVHHQPQERLSRPRKRVETYDANFINAANIPTTVRALGAFKMKNPKTEEQKETNLQSEE